MSKRFVHNSIIQDIIIFRNNPFNRFNTRNIQNFISSYNDSKQVSTFLFNRFNARNIQSFMPSNNYLMSNDSSPAVDRISKIRKFMTSQHQ